MSSDNCRYWKEGVESEGEVLDEAQKWHGCHMFEAFYLHGKHSIGSPSWRDWLAAAPETSFDPGTGRRRPGTDR